MPNKGEGVLLAPAWCVMRLRFLLGGILVLVSGLHAAAQAPGQSGRINVAETDVLAIPSPKSPATGKLRLGDTVQIKAKVNDYYEIVPPTGSFSWIPDRVVQALDPRTLSVLGDEVPVRYGSSGVLAPLAIESRAKVKRGAQVSARGEKVTYEGAAWWPIEPIPGESRYILASALATPTMSSETSAGATRPTAAGNIRDPNANRPKEWRLAEQAEQEGRYDDAIRLYTELCRMNSQPGGDFTLAVLCQNRIRELQPLRRTPASTASRMGRSGIDPSNPPAPPLPGARTTGRNLVPPPPSYTDGIRTSGPGYLRRAGIQVDGQTTYALETSRGDLLLYVTPEPSVNLEPYVNRGVELHGTIRTRGDVRGAPHMYATRVLPLR